MKKSAARSRKTPLAAAALKKLQASAKAASERTAAAKKQARAAKLRAREARKLFKQAKKVARVAKDELQSLSKKLQLVLSDVAGRAADGASDVKDKLSAAVSTAIKKKKKKKVVAGVAPKSRVVAKAKAPGRRTNSGAAVPAVSRKPARRKGALRKKSPVAPVTDQTAATPATTEEAA
jgi:inorganic triphosphatase YgiF